MFMLSVPGSACAHRCPRLQPLLLAHGYDDVPFFARDAADADLACIGGVPAAARALLVAAAAFLASHGHGAA